MVILVHGMQEYSDRYASFCKYLNAKGYSTIRYDLLGHGKNLPRNQRGYFGKNGWKNLLKQLHQYVQQAHLQFPGQKIILFGHSMGSIIIRSYLQHYHDFDGMILSGVPYYNPLWKVGKVISKTLINVKGAHHHSHFLNKLTTGSFNKKVHNPSLLLTGSVIIVGTCNHIFMTPRVAFHLPTKVIVTYMMAWASWASCVILSVSIRFPF